MRYWFRRNFGGYRPEGYSMLVSLWDCMGKFTGTNKVTGAWF